MLFADNRKRKHAISRLVGFFVTNCIIVEEDRLSEPLVRFRIDMKSSTKTFLSSLKDLVYSVVVRSPEVQHLEFKGQQMVVAVFETLASEPEAFLPRDTWRTYVNSGKSIRVICDHVAGMTDGFLLKTYERLFSPRMGSIFDKL